MVDWDKGVGAGAIRRRCVKTLKYTLPQKLFVGREIHSSL
jgi:hypothetical protein